MKKKNLKVLRLKKSKIANMNPKHANMALGGTGTLFSLCCFDNEENGNGTTATSTTKDTENCPTRNYFCPTVVLCTNEIG